MAEEPELVEYALVNAEGETLKSSRHYTGKGQATYPNQDTYDGDFEDGVRSGSGKYTYVSKGGEEVQDVYEGEWKDNLKHGIGKQTYAGKGSYYGYWEAGRRHGEGVFTYTNQDVYSGLWSNGVKEGKGTYVFFQTGMKLVGVWKNGEMIEGKWAYPNGSFYSGFFDHNKPKGKGRWTFENGNVVEGEYKQAFKADSDADEIKLAWTTSSDITKAPAQPAAE